MKGPRRLGHNGHFIHEETQKTRTQLSFHVQGDFEDWDTNVILYLVKKTKRRRLGHNSHHLQEKIWKTGTQPLFYAQRNLEDLDTTVMLGIKKSGGLPRAENVILCIKRFGRLRHNCTFMPQAIWMIGINRRRKIRYKSAIT